MQTLKRTLFWIVLLFLLETWLVACTCSAPSSFRYANERLTALSLDNSGAQPQLSRFNSVHKNAYGIRMNIERTRVAAISESWHVGNMAYATTKRCSAEYNPTAAIENIRIITLHDFDATHSAGADLTVYFKQVKSGKFYDIETLYDGASQVFIDDMLMPLEADMLLIKAPEYIGMHAFAVEARLSDGTLLSDTTSVQLY